MPVEFTKEEQREFERELLAQLIQSAEINQVLKGVDNKRIGELLFYHVWSNMDLLSPQSCLIEQAYLRLGFDPDAT